MNEDILSPAIVRRTKHRQYSRWEWQWLYSVNGVTIGTCFAEVKSYCKRHGFTPVLEWKAELGEQKPEATA